MLKVVTARLPFRSPITRQPPHGSRIALWGPSLPGCLLPHNEYLIRRVTLMLAEKFILLIETLKSHASPDGSYPVVSTSPHVPVKLPAASNKSFRDRAVVEF